MAALGSSIVLFGGANFIGGTDYADTWIFDGSTWTQKTGLSPSPGVRDSHVMATVGNKVVLFGGEKVVGTSFVPLGDTWVFDGSAWTPITATPSPSARFYSGMAALGGNAVLFGGNAASGAVGETWVFDGAIWTKQTVSGGPTARCGHTMASR